MKVLLLTWKSFGIEDIRDAFRELGHHVVELPYSDKDEVSDKSAVSDFEKKVKDANVDCIFSFNYFPLVAIACKNLGMPYISWIYDRPYVRLYHYAMAYPTDHV